jgi:ribosomal protein L22
MALRIPQRRLIEPGKFNHLMKSIKMSTNSLRVAFNALRPCPSCRQSPASPFRIFARAASSKDKTKLTGNKRVDDFLKAKPEKTAQVVPQRGNVAEDSIFEDAEQEEAFNEDKQDSRQANQPDMPQIQERNSSFMRNILDPNPQQRAEWERKVLVKQVKTRGRLTKKQLLKRTERESLTKSQWLKTSTKKLGMLARQIAGKPIEEAIVQMRFSKKRIAQDLKKHLEYSRDMAIVSRGMGLGKAKGTQGEPVEIELKDGKRKKITDRTGIYVDQAWVNRGPHGSEIDYRARGQANTMKNPFTSKPSNISIISSVALY